jgi:hypothetical protein
MPPAIDPRNTFRLWVNYNDSIYDHALQFRYDGDVTSESDVMEVADTYLTALSDNIHTITIGVVEFAGEGTNVRNPVVWGFAASYGSGAMPTVQAPRYVEFTGKDGTGHRWHLTQFGVNITNPDDWVLRGEALGHIDDARSALQTAFNVGTIISINKLKVRVNLEVPVGYNDHFVVQARG